MTEGLENKHKQALLHEILAMLKTNLRRVSNTGQFSTSQSTGHHVACSAGVFWVGETLFMFVFVLLYKPPSLIL